MQHIYWSLPLELHDLMQWPHITKHLTNVAITTTDNWNHHGSFVVAVLCWESMPWHWVQCMHYIHSYTWKCAGIAYYDTRQYVWNFEYIYRYESLPNWQFLQVKMENMDIVVTQLLHFPNGKLMIGAYTCNDVSACIHHEWWCNRIYKTTSICTSLR